MQATDYITQKQLLNRARRYRRRVNATFHAYKGDHKSSGLPYIVYAVDALNTNKPLPAVDTKIIVNVEHECTYRISPPKYSYLILVEYLHGESWFACGSGATTAAAMRCAIHDLQRRAGVDTKLWIT